MGANYLQVICSCDNPDHYDRRNEVFTQGTGNFEGSIWVYYSRVCRNCGETALKEEEEMNNDMSKP